MYFEKRRNKPMVIALITILIMTSMLPFMTDTAMAFSGKVGSVYTVWDAGRIEYGSGDGGYSNSKKCDLDDGLGTRYSYCVQPDKPSPTATRVTVDKVVTDEADTGKWNCLRNICYYSPTYPGYDNNVKSIVDNYYTGNAAKDFGIAHLAMSYVYKGRPDDLDTWNDTHASDLGEVWTKAKKLANALWKDGTGKDDAVPDNFKVFICKMEGVQDMVVGFMQAPGSLSMKKSSNLTKISDDNGMYSFEGAEYTVYDSDDKEVGTLTTDADGSSDEIELAEGTYTVKETYAPPGYAKDSETYTVTVESEEESTFKAKETPITAKIEILIEKDPEGYSHNYGEGDATLKGAVFKVDYYDSETAPGEPILMKASKKAKATWYFVTDAKGQVSGSDPSLSKDYESDKLFKDDDGNVVWPLGSYVVTEVKAPKGYLLNDESTFIHVYEDGTDKAYTKGYNKAIIPDEIIRGGVKLAKVDRVRNLNVPQGDATLKNAEFTIYNKSEHSVIVNGTEYNTDKAVLTIKTDAEGNAATGSDVLPYGTYMAKETKAPTGYFLNESWEQTFKVREDGEIVDLTGTKVDEAVKLGGILIHKVDSDLKAAEAQGDASLEGAEFTIYNKSAESIIVNGTEYAKDAEVMTIVTGSDGNAETEQVLPYGTYLIKETKPSEGYLLNDTFEATVEVRKDHVTVEVPEITEEEVMRGGVKLQKIDNDTGDAYSQGDASLERAEFTITNRSTGRVVVDGNAYAPGEDVLVIVTDANGLAESAKDALPYGTYSIKETKPSDGYLLNTEWEKEFEIREDGQIIDLTKDTVREAVIRSGVQVVKRDKELGASEAQGGATLEGIVMTIKNVSNHDVIVRTDIGSDETVDWKTLGPKTDLFEAGKIKRVMPGEDVGSITVHWNEDLKAYTAETLPDDLPYGTYTIRESKTNDSYQRTDKTEHMFEVREDGRLYSYTDEVQEIVRGMNELFAFDNYVYRSDVQGTKIADSTSERFSYVPFKIISVTNGETHVVVTDKNGFFSTKDRRQTDELDEDEAADNTRKINPFDDLLETETITNAMMEERYSDIRMGVWFGTGEFGSKAEPDPTIGALPYDTYILEEMSCERNEGYTLQKFIFTVDEKSRTGFVDLETITDDCPEIGTTASVNGKNSNVKVDSEIILIDVVEYSNLKRGDTYTVKGKLIDKATGEIVRDAQGNEVTAETSFKAGRTNGKIKVKFVFDGSNMYDMDTVVFESLYDADGHIVAKHEDINDEFQTVIWEKLEPAYEMYKVRTTKAPKKGDKFGFHALDMVEYDVHIENTGNITLTMDVTDQYADTEYFTEPVVKTVRFTDKGTWNNEGDGHTANITISPGETAVVSYTASVKDEAVEYLASDKKDSDSKDEKGKDTNIIYQFNVTDDNDGYVNTAKCENVSYPDPKNPEEPKPLEPKEDTSQTPVQKPVIGTTLTDIDGNKEVVTSDKTVLIDKIEHEGLDTSKWYIFEGTLIVKDTGDPLVENGEEISVLSDPFKPSRPDSIAEISFEIDTTGLDGKELVAFETAYRLNGYVDGDDVTAADKTVVAEHRDINDEGQTIKLIKPDEPETPEEPTEPDEPETPAPKKTVIPKTGDTTNILLPALVLVISGTGLAYVMRRRKKH